MGLPVSEFVFLNLGIEIIVIGTSNAVFACKLSNQNNYDFLFLRISLTFAAELNSLYKKI